MVKSSESKPSALVKPTLETRFHIDYAWWERSSEDDLRTYKLSQLPPELVERLAGADDTDVVDYIDPDTAEVRELDRIGLAVQEAAARPDYIGQHVSMVDCIFRVFLSNGNQPLTPVELSEITGRPAQQILRTLGGARVYKGIRPAHG